MVPDAQHFAAQLIASGRVQFLADSLELSPDEWSRLSALVMREYPQDHYTKGGLVAHIEQWACERTAFPAALAVPSGTAANMLALSCAAQPGTQILAAANSHVVRDSAGGLSLLTNSTLSLVHSAQHCPSPQELKSQIHHMQQNKFPIPVGVLSLESPVRRANESRMALEELQEISACCRSHGIHCHLDAARLLPWLAWADLDLKQLCSLVDSISFSLWKGFHSTAGALLCGSSTLIAKARLRSPALGCSPRRLWPLIAGAQPFLGRALQDLKETRHRVEDLAAALTQDGFLKRHSFPLGSCREDWHFPDCCPDKLAAALCRREIDFPPVEKNRRFALRFNASLLRMSPDHLLEVFRESINTAKTTKSSS